MSAAAWLPAGDPGLGWVAPQPVERGPGEIRLERFPAAVAQLLAGQIGPLANLRSSPGCGVRLRTDSPWVALRLARLRHHQPIAQSVAIEIHAADGVRTADSGDLREFEGDHEVRLPTGLERGGACADVALWLPPVATCAIAGVGVAEGSRTLPVDEALPRLLCLGDSLVQGFSCASPLHTWPHRVASGVGHWNLGVGGLRIEPEAFAWAFDAQPWEACIIGLGSNMAWHAADLDRVAETGAAFARRACASRARRVLWLIPPWKPCEDGKGPGEFMGLRLDAEQGRRFGLCRQVLREALAAFAPRLELVEAPPPRDHRFYPDGLHPFAPGFAAIARAITATLADGPVPGTDP